MGTRGPVGKRDAERVRGNKGKTDTTVVNINGEDAVEIPAADPNWHPIAIYWYESLAKSGQARFYEPSDWGYAWSVADDLSYYKNCEKRSGQMLQSIYSAMTELLTTEGARRRVRMEIERAPEYAEPAEVKAFNAYRGMGL